MGTKLTCFWLLGTFWDSSHFIWCCTHILYLLPIERGYENWYVWLSCYIKDLCCIFLNWGWKWNFSFNNKESWCMVILNLTVKFEGFDLENTFSLWCRVIIWWHLTLCEIRYIQFTKNSEYKAKKTCFIIYVHILMSFSTNLTN